MATGGSRRITSEIESTIAIARALRRALIAELLGQRVRIRLLSTFSEVRDILECGVLALEYREYGEDDGAR